MKATSFSNLPLFIPHSHTSTAVNKTGSWRFFHPRYDEKTAPCSAACPLGQDIARIETLTSSGLYKDARQLILNENPFPAVCGRVCFHPCERACNRSGLDAPVAIHHLERFLGDTALAGEKTTELTIKSSRGKKVAIAGAGPAGLSAAYFLTRLGYGCDIFEADDGAGGLLRSGIPTYRLPRNILAHEIKRIEDLGVNIHFKTPVTANLLEKIYTEYDALFIGCGYGQSIRLKIDGGRLAGDGLDLLHRLHRGEKMSFSGKAAVIGGGNTAVDVARSLARLGASPLIVYRRRLEDMPAFEPEIKMALEEGVAIMELAAPIQIQPHRGNLSAARFNYTLTLQQMKISSREISGRARVVPDGEKTQTINVQDVFAAVGTEADALWNFSETDKSGSLTLSHCRVIPQKIPVIFGGDLASPVKSVSDAIASGKQAALALDTYFDKGLDAVESALAACRVGPGPALALDAYLGENRRDRNDHVVTYDEIVSDYFKTTPRATPPTLDANRRRQSFAEIETTLAGAAAEEEAARCFNCGICNACDYCRLYCPEMAVRVEQARRSIDMDYCKGCGVCVTECPRNAMALEEEIK
jgi:NADPH-dependent glutamate synthase beta subunit-like oxidoreductase/Pyruvate/2-oxoacid:ferredoxin oxidoreductase delta subunit